STSKIILRMQLVFNELSLLPLPESVQVAEMNFRTMIGTFKKAKEVIGFKNILFQNNLSNQIVIEQINFVQLLDLLENKDLKRALIILRMQLVFNELSLLPLPESVQVAEMNFRTMIGTFKKAKEVIGFKNILFQNNLSNQIVIEQINFVQLLDLLENKDLKRALIT